MSKQGFGNARPLPGQAGYRSSETDHLEKEAKEMEVRLQMLQARMQQQNEDDAALSKPGGARWRSARTDKGSVTAYAKDVQERIKKRTGAVAHLGTSSAISGVADDGSNSFGKSMAASRRQMRQQQGVDFRTKDIGDWSVGDVRDWLNAVLLSQYAPIFEGNEINGPILLEISLEDLDYMGMTILGHRKVLLKGIEDLRKNRRVTINLAAAAPMSSSSLSQASGLTTQSLESLKDPLRTAASGALKAAPALLKSQEEPRGGPYMHWSQLDPISNNQVRVADGRPTVNLADGDMVDEAAEQAAFSEAVMEWRRGGGGRVQIEREGEFKDSSSMVGASLSQSAGTWNPFGPSVATAGVIDDEDDYESGGVSLARSITESKNGGLDIGKGRVPPVSSSRSYLQQEGELDEAAEREEFRRAVEEWRSGGTGSKTKASVGASLSSQSPRVEAGAGRALADRLAKELEQEQATTQRQLQLQREEAQRKLQEANRELEEARRSRVASSQFHLQSGTEEEGISYSYSQPPVGAVNGRVSRSSTQDTADLDGAAFTPPLSPHLSDDEDFRPQSRVESKAEAKAECKGAISGSKGVALALVETSMGSRDFDAEEKQAYYVVEEESDED